MGQAGWLNAFPLGPIIRQEDGDWGLLKSRRVFYSNGFEVEFGITSVAWVVTDPVDEGTARVVRDGMRILYDPSGVPTRLQATIEARG